MKCIALSVLGVVALSSGALAQAPDPIATAVAAAPANMRDGATVIKWKPDFTYDTLRKGTNRLVCYDRSGFPGQQAFSIECTSIANLDRVAQNMKIEAMGDKKQATFDAAEKDGTRVKPEYGSVWYHLMGPDKDHPRSHHHRRARRDDGHNRPARQQQAGWSVDFERRHDDRTPHDAWRIAACRRAGGFLRRIVFRDGDPCAAQCVGLRSFCPENAGGSPPARFGAPRRHPEQSTPR